MAEKKIQVKKREEFFNPSFHPDFREKNFESAIKSKGAEVIFEKSLKCPCKGRNTEHLSSCKNCGGSGWVFINPVKTRMLVQSVSFNPQYESWGVYGSDISSISALNEDKLSVMDRVTVLDSESEFSEVLHTNMRDGLNYSYTVYEIIDVYYVGLFMKDDEKLLKLESGKDFSYEGRKVTLSSDFSAYDRELSFVVRYKHHPQFHIVEMVRDSGYTKKLEGRFEKTSLLPIHARAKRAEVIKDIENFSGDRIIDNSFLNCDKDYK